MKMNKSFALRALGLGLVVVLMMSISVCALADSFSVTMPARISDLDIPDVPDALDLSTWTDSVATGNPCPILAVDGAIMHLQFSDQPDAAVASWYKSNEQIEVDANGYAELVTDGRKIQAGYTFNGSGASEKPWFICASKGNVTAGYDNSGDVQFIELTVDGDMFGTGIEGAKSVIRYEPITIDGDFYQTFYLEGTAYKFNMKGRTFANGTRLYHYYTVWYVPSVTTIYPEGSALTRIVARFWNTEKGDLRKYKVYYSPTGAYECAREKIVTEFPHSKPVSRAMFLQPNDNLTIQVK